MGFAKRLKEQVLQGHEVTKEEVMLLVDESTAILSELANEIRQHFCGNAFDVCSIISGKNGACSEDCKYCAQSAHYTTGIPTYDLLDEERITQTALENEAEGVVRYSIVTSGKRLAKREVKEVVKRYKHIGEQSRIKLCASHGLLDAEDLQQLKEVGVTCYHNNLETSRRFFSSMCTTHTYDEKIDTIKAVKSLGLKVCSGGLFGLGETMEDRIDMAFELRDLEVDSIPVNVLVPIPGTPLEHAIPISEDEVLKTIAIYRYIHPKVKIRLAGGRNQLTEAGKKAFLGGANATISGNLLTTCGNNIKEDMELIKSCGYVVSYEK